MALLLGAVLKGIGKLFAAVGVEGMFESLDPAETPMAIGNDLDEFALDLADPR